jgi:hypothetical protein
MTAGQLGLPGKRLFQVRFWLPGKTSREEVSFRFKKVFPGRF